ncbi:MAG: D-alanyl-D-alanine carboxypeptidase [Nitriliruptorales bacterium]|nr:D-alanyl-D-alanine carboxypeptidase [Nitriliruptorales bacterium]
MEPAPPRVHIQLTALLVAATVGLVVGFGPLANRTSPVPVPRVDPTVQGALTDAPSPSPSPSPPPEPTTADTVVAAHVRHLVNVADVAGADWAVSVRGADGQVILDHHGDDLLMPASTLKSLTAAAALLTFGPDHRFRTEARVDGIVTAGGTLVGNLVLVGGGDPVLGSPAFHEWYPARPRTHLEDLADSVVASGVRVVFGRVVGLDPVLVGPGLAAGWKDRYLWDFDARRIAGLTVDAGIRLTRGTALAVTAGGEEGLVGAVAEDPRLTAAHVFEAMLLARGVRFAEPAIGQPDPVVVDGLTEALGVPPRSRSLGAVESPPLWRILRFMIEHSDNQLADTIARVVAADRVGDPTWAGITPAFVDVLAELGIEPDGLAVEDGSGLSRSNRVSASVLAEVQAALAAGELAPVWAEMQAVAGERGTLRTWLRGTPAVGRFLGKTGTLDDVKGLTGTVWGPGETAFHLAVLVNDAGAARGNVRVLMDQLVLTLGAALDGCMDLESVGGLGAWAGGACPASAPTDQLVPQLPSEGPTDAASVAPPDVVERMPVP